MKIIVSELGETFLLLMFGAALIGMLNMVFTLVSSY